MHHVSYKRGPNSAIDDLKELPEDVRIELMCVAETELKTRPDDADPDEGIVARADSPLMWRRGVTRGRRRQLLDSETDDASHDLDDESAAWNYVLIYRRRTIAEARTLGERGFMVLRVVHNRQLAQELLRIASG